MRRKRSIEVQLVLPWDRIPRESLRLLACPRRLTYPHAVLEFRDVPGLGDITAGFCHSQKNRLTGVGLNQAGVGGVMSCARPQFFYLLGRPFDSVEDAIAAAGQPDLKHRDIPGFFVQTENILDYMIIAPKEKRKPSRLRLELGLGRSALNKVIFADPEDFSIPLEVKK